MSKEIRSKIYQMLEGIEDEVMLNQVMEDVFFYTSKNDITDNLDSAQLNELDKAIKELILKTPLPGMPLKRK